MPDLEQKDFPDEQKDFLIEKIKEKPVNKKKLIRRTIITISMAVIFGLVACVTFLVLEPVISNWLYPEEEPEIQTVEFPEDLEEMSPEEMLAENLPTESPEPTPMPSREPVQSPDPEGGEETEVRLGEEQVQEILAQVTFDLNHYKELYAALHEYGNELSRYIVTVTAVTSNIDWFNSVQERENQCSGVIISENGMELLILTDYSAIRSAERLRLTFYDESQVEAQLKQHNEATNLAVLSVPLEALSDEVRGSRQGAQEGSEGRTEEGQEGAGSQGQEGTESQGAPGESAPDGQGAEGQGVQGPESLVSTEGPQEEGLPIVKFGYSNSKSLIGTPVIAIGSPVGTSNSISYGMITASGTTVSASDRNYRILLTDISGSQNASGVLFDLQGRMLGIITNHRTGTDMRNLITAYGITDLQKTVEKMSNGALIAYLGIRGADVPREANQELGIPFGAYVEEFDMDSPAMLAGIQRGDVITAIGGKNVSSFAEYSKALMDLEPGDTVEVAVMRQAQEEYREMKFNIELGGVR
ncbi:PDZ domain-containing protein [Acetatifactor aquisgranensis]|uniref:PDZ domain-containing protein n=1 Tax=Acetatifactor aquisgranensis TaxID=2941233 RepID=UPI00203D232A|nr:PDZ domain-containing protein [Acetatifactor aquisgranensis]